MPENILVVEYEPRYTDRVTQALAGQPYHLSFARDGEEAIRALDGEAPRLIVLSSVVPKISTSDLIHAIRERESLAATPILLTVSGYVGRVTKADAERMGASDILAKPYSETEFLGKVNEMLGPGQKPLTSDDIFGDLLEDENHPTARRAMNPTDDVDKLLEQTLSGMMPRKKDPHAAPTSPGTVPLPKTTLPASEAKPKTHGGTSDFDKLVQDTLSGLEKKPRVVKAPTSPGAPQSEPAAAVATPPPAMTEKVLLSQPVIAPKPVAAPVPEEEPTDGIKYGQYVLLDKIATGGMAEVWKARMRGVEGFQKIVAIKKILPHLSDNQDFIEMFIDEAKLAAQLNHNNIIHIYDLGKTQGTYFIAMEYVDGHDLKTILMRGHERDQPLGIELSLFIASKVAAALDYAHRRRDFEDKELSLVHRDVSPQNVLISQEGDIKLCDFGIAKAASKASHTQAGALKGKLQYMSPEQAWGKPIDRRSDIFALATVLFEMLTGKKLFAGDNEISVLEQVREPRVTPPSQINDEITPQIDAIVLKALNKEPGQRYQTAGEMARDIDSVLYNMRPTPTSADLAIYMHRIWIEEPLTAIRSDAPPTLIDQPVPAAVRAAVPAPPPSRGAAAVATPAPAAAAAVPMPPWEAPARKKSIVPIAVAAVVVLAIGIGAIVMLKGRGTATPTPAAAAKAQPSGVSTTPVPLTTNAAASPGATQTIVPAATDTPPTSTQPPVIDQAQVDAEVQKRIAAERARLEEQSRSQQAQAAPATPPRSVPVVTATQAAVQPAPAPVTQTVPPPPPPAPATTSVAETPAAPPPASEAPQRAREGDLVEAGAEGLTPARITRQAQATYPQIARIQRLEGSVVMNVLVSESGQVLETRVISGARSALLNDAAQQAVRRSTFAPGTKDGVRVKSWATVRIDFKL